MVNIRLVLAPGYAERSIKRSKREKIQCFERPTRSKVHVPPTPATTRASSSILPIQPCTLASPLFTSSPSTYRHNHSTAGRTTISPYFSEPPPTNPPDSKLTFNPFNASDNSSCTAARSASDESGP